MLNKTMRKAAWLAGKLQYSQDAVESLLEGLDLEDLMPQEEVDIEGEIFNSHANRLQYKDLDGFSYIPFTDLPEIIELNQTNFKSILSLFI